MNIKSLKIMVKRYLRPVLNCTYEKENREEVFDKLLQNLAVIDKIPCPQGLHGKWSLWVFPILLPCVNHPGECPYIESRHNIFGEPYAGCELNDAGKCQQYKTYQELEDYLKSKGA